MKRAAFALALALLAGPALGQEPNLTAAKVTNSGTSITAQALAPSLAAQPGLMNYVCGFSITGGGATSAAIILPTLTGVNGGTMTFTVGVVAGVTLGNPPLNVSFYPCQPASALNTAITLSVPTYGTGNVSSNASIWGYRGPY